MKHKDKHKRRENQTCKGKNNFGLNATNYNQKTGNNNDTDIFKTFVQHFFI